MEHYLRQIRRWLRDWLDPDDLPRDIDFLKAAVALAKEHHRTEVAQLTRGLQGNPIKAGTEEGTLEDANAQANQVQNRQMKTVNRDLRQAVGELVRSGRRLIPLVKRLNSRSLRWPRCRLALDDFEGLLDHWEAEGGEGSYQGS